MRNFACNQRVFWWEGTAIRHRFEKHYGKFIRNAEEDDRYLVQERGEYKKIHKDRVFSITENTIKESIIYDEDGSLTRRK